MNELVNWHWCDTCGRRWTHERCVIMNGINGQRLCSGCGAPPNRGERYIDDEFTGWVRIERQKAGIIDE